MGPPGCLPFLYLHLSLSLEHFLVDPSEPSMLTLCSHYIQPGPAFFIFIPDRCPLSLPDPAVIIFNRTFPSYIFRYIGPMCPEGSFGLLVDPRGLGIFGAVGNVYLYRLAVVIGPGGTNLASWENGGISAILEFPLFLASPNSRSILGKSSFLYVAGLLFCTCCCFILEVV